MAMPNRSSKRPRDPNQLAKLVVEIATGEADPPEDFGGKNPAAVMLGRLGGKKGGAARAATLSSQRRRQIAVKAAHARWDKRKD
jgi:hypothetical protein